MSRPAWSLVAALLSFAPVASAQSWTDATADTIGDTGEWTNRVELADVDGDGWIDLVFANGGDYASAGSPEPQKVWRNRGAWSGPPPYFEDISDDVFGATGDRLSRVIKARDVDGDGDVDLFVGGAWGTASALYRRDADGWTEVSATALPPDELHLGDAELGDVDGDGDLDLVLVDWGGPPLASKGGRVHLWLNDGDGAFADATDDRVPATLMRWSWDVELVDVDDDADLDVLVSSKLSAGGTLYLNDGAGAFTEARDRLPQATNNYEYEPVDLDGDGDLDLVTINDGENLKETVLVNDGGTFADASDAWLTGDANAGVDDNVVGVLDVDSDGDADLLLAALDSRDRVLRNDGDRFVRFEGIYGAVTPGTLGLGIADLDRDGRLDVILGAGESGFADRVFLAGDGVAVDATPPVVRTLRRAAPGDLVVVARVHDHRNPGVLDLRRVAIELVSSGTAPPIDMTWRGEHLWVATLPDGDPELRYRVCATDAAGNPACGPVHALADAPDAGGGDGGGDPGTDPGGCCRASRGGGAGALLLVGAVVAALRRRR